MDINVKTIHCSLSDEQVERFEEALQRHFSKYVFLRKGQINITKLTDLSWEVTISILPNRGDSLFVKAEEETVEKAYAEALEKAERRVKKLKQAKTNISRETINGD